MRDSARKDNCSDSALAAACEANWPRRRGASVVSKTVQKRDRGASWFFNKAAYDAQNEACASRLDHDECEPIAQKKPAHFI